MALDPTVTGATDGLCGRFLGTENETEGTCTYEYSQVVAKTSTEPLKIPDSTSGFRLYRAVVSLTSIVDFSVLTYTHGAEYGIV
jgi:hypothetical protein